jgi:hypothetical protein
MRTKIHRNELTKDIFGYGIAGAGLVVGTKVVEGIGGSASAGVSGGAVTAAGYFPTVANLLIVKHTLKQVNKLYSHKKNRRGFL